MAAMPDDVSKSNEDAEAARLAPLGLELRWQSLCLLVLTVLAVGYALYTLRPVLVPFILAVFLTVGLAPLLDLIERRLHANRLIAVAVAFVLGLVGISLLGFLISTSVRSLEADSGKYTENIGATLEATSINLEKFGFKHAAESLHNVAENIGEQLARLWQYALGVLQRAMIDLLGTLAMVLIFMFFLLLGASGQVRPTEGLWSIMEAKFREYLVVKTVISVFTGLAFGLVLWLFDVPLAFVMGLLAFLLNYIPNVGPIIASLLPIPLILATPELGFLRSIFAIALSSGVQVISGNVIEPKMMGDSFELHPIVILLSLMLWGMIWGIVGMLLAVPITAAIKIVLEKIDRTRPIAELMAGRLDAINFESPDTRAA